MTPIRWIAVAVIIAGGIVFAVYYGQDNTRRVAQTEGGNDAPSTLDQVVAKTGDPEAPHPLAGQNLKLRILGLSEWAPSELAGEMAEGFAEYAERTHGYSVQVSFRGAPFWELFDSAAAFLSAGSQEYHLLISDSQWLGAFADAGWITNINQLIDRFEELNFEWWDPIVKDAYMEYPEGSGRYWGMPLETDVIGLYVRKDLFLDEGERARFRERYDRDLPQTFADFERLTMKEFEDIAAFFTRPEDNLYGTTLQYSLNYDFASMFLYPFLWSSGGRIWDPAKKQIYGILNSDINAAAMTRQRDWMRYQPPDVIHYGIAENIDAFVSGRVATAFQWCAVGSAMGNSDDFLVMPPPAFVGADEQIRRIYPIGGQPWVINAHNDSTQMRLIVDFLLWWYTLDNQRKFAERGGNPAIKSLFNEPGFNDIQPWFATLKYMLRREHGRDFWHHPKYAEMLAVQQRAFVDFARGRIDDASLALDFAASQQQLILYQYDTSAQPPPENVEQIQHRYEAAVLR